MNEYPMVRALNPVRNEIKFQNENIIALCRNRCRFFLELSKVHHVNISKGPSSQVPASTTCCNFGTISSWKSARENRRAHKTTPPLITPHQHQHTIPHHYFNAATSGASLPDPIHDGSPLFCSILLFLIVLYPISKDNDHCTTARLI